MNEYIFSEITIFQNKKPVEKHTLFYVLPNFFNMWLNRKAGSLTSASASNLL